MEVRKGYKQTELGVIPNDWDIVPINSILEKGTRITYGVVQPGENIENGVPFIRGGDIFSGKINERQLRNISHSISKTYKRTLLQGREILISLVGYPGEAAIVPDRLAGANIARQVALIRLSKEVLIHPEYVCYFLLSDMGKWLLLREVLGSAQQVINLKDINKLVVLLPKEKSEQIAIAATLSDVDALLSSLDALIAKKRLIKQGAMLELLTGKKRLPGFSGEWKVMNLGDICGKITTGKLDANAMREDGEYRFYTCAKEYYQIDAYAFDTEALLVSGNGANVGYIHYYKGKFNAYQRTYVLFDFSEDIFFVKLIMDQYLQQRIKVEVNAGNTPYIKMDTLAGMEIRLPNTKSEQTAIAEILSDMDAEISALEQKREKTRLLKQGMMQELLTGRIRLV